MTKDVADAMREFAEFATAGADVPPSVLQRAALLIADTLGIGIRGSAIPTSVALRAMAAAGPAEILAAPPGTAGVEDAVLCNAVAICSMELDEGVRPTGHPALHVLPPVLAAAQADDRSGAEFLRAFVLGYEAQARLQRAAVLRPPVHCHGTYGHVGAAVGLAVLRGWDARRTVAVVNAAAASASATSYSLPYAGATVHVAAPALSGAAALRASRLVQAGLTAWEGSVEEVYGGILGTSIAAEPLRAGLGTRWAVEDAYVKFHGTCGHAHSALDALIDAFGGGGLPGTLAAPVTLADIDEIIAEIPGRACELSATDVTTDLGARFSVPLSIAAFLRHGDTSPDAFSPAALADPDVWRLARRIRLVPRPDFDRDFLHHHRARVLVRLRDGSTVRGVCDNPYGNAMNPAAVEHVEQKFLANLRGAGAISAGQLAWAAALAVGERASMRGFCGALVGVEA